jgi:6,7-dimethyl-8-ribityllumazine synthase
MSKDKKKKSGSKSGKIAIVVSRFNNEVTTGLLNGAISELVNSGRDKNDVRVVECPGAFEIPLVVKELCRSGKYCGIICLGAVIKGETAHFEYISYAVTKGISALTLEFEIPIAFGVLTCYNDEQAVKRSQDNAENKGAEAAKSVIEMIDILKSI